MRTTWKAAAALALATATLGSGIGPAHAAPGPGSGARPAPAAIPHSVQCTTVDGADFTWDVCVDVTATTVRGTATYRPANGGTGRVVRQVVAAERCQLDRQGCVTVAGPTTGRGSTVRTPVTPIAGGWAFRACGRELQDTAGVRSLDVCSPAVPIADERSLPAVVVSSPDYDVELITHDEGSASGPAVTVRRVDRVGNPPGLPGPDGYGALTTVGWGPLGGGRCLASAGGTYGFADTTTERAFTYGLAGARIARVRIVGEDGSRTTVATRASVTGGALRPWLTERPITGLARIEGLDARGAVVATITAPGLGDFGSSPTCT